MLCNEKSMGTAFYKTLLLLWYYSVKHLLGEYHIRSKRAYIIVWLSAKFDNSFFQVVYCNFVFMIDIVEVRFLLLVLFTLRQFIGF